MGSHIGHVQSIFQTLFRRVRILGNKLQKFLPIGKVISKLEIDVGYFIVPFPLAKHYLLHLVSLSNGQSHMIYLISLALIPNNIYYVFFPAHLSMKKMLLSHRPWYSCPWDISSHSSWITWHSMIRLPMDIDYGERMYHSSPEECSTPRNS